MFEYQKKYFIYYQIRQSGTGGFNASELYYLNTDQKIFRLYPVKMDDAKIVGTVSEYLDKKKRYIQWQIYCNKLSDNNLSFNFITYKSYKKDNGMISGNYFLKKIKKNSYELLPDKKTIRVRKMGS